MKGYVCKGHVCKDDSYKLLNEEVVYVDRINKCLIKANHNTFKWDDAILSTVRKANTCVRVLREK